jgi:hypothetical protein
MPADVLRQMFPVGAGNDPETLRCHTLKIGGELWNQPAVRPETAAPAIAVTSDSTFIRSCEDGERHLEVRVGNVETETGWRQVFGAVAKADTDIKVLIRRSLDAVGRTDDTVLTAFTDGLRTAAHSRRCRRHRGADARLVSYRYANPASQANSLRLVGR